MVVAVLIRTADLMPRQLLAPTTPLPLLRVVPFSRLKTVVITLPQRVLRPSTQQGFDLSVRPFTAFCTLC